MYVTITVNTESLIRISFEVYMFEKPLFAISHSCSFMVFVNVFEHTFMLFVLISMN